MEEVLTQVGKITEQGPQYLIIIQAENHSKIRPFLNQKVSQEIRFKKGGKSVVIEQKGMIVYKTYASGLTQAQIFIQKKNLSKIADFLGMDGIDEEILISSVVPTLAI